MFNINRELKICKETFFLTTNSVGSGIQNA